MNRPAAAPSFRLDIQGLRAVAVLLVVLYHAGLGGFDGGYVGVDVFFVISGFLITRHLYSDLGSGGRVSFASFYAKRARRILPASILVLLATIAATYEFVPPLMRMNESTNFLGAAAYVPNIVFAREGTDYLADTTPSVVQHYWSLGIEEQFYLVWPLVLVGIWRLTGSRRRSALLTAELMAFSFILCIVLTTRDQPSAFFLLPSRAWELGTGALLAAIPARAVARVPLGVKNLIGLLGLGAIGFATCTYSAETVFPGYRALLPVAGAAAVLLSGIGGNDTPVGRLLSIRPMVFIGTISYSLYLVHWPALLVSRLAVAYGGEMPLPTNLLIVAICVPVAWGLYRFVEEPARRADIASLRRPRNVLLVSGAASVASLLVGVGYGRAVENPVLSTEHENAAVAPTTAPVFSNVVPRNLAPSLSASTGDLASIYGNGCHHDQGVPRLETCKVGESGQPVIALFGDSHSAQWYPALEQFGREHGYTIEVATRSSCSSAIVDDPSRYNPHCHAWRDLMIGYLNGTRPELVLVSNFAGKPAEDSEANAAEWEDGYTELLNRLEPATAIIADTPFMETRPAYCLSAHLEHATKCDRSLEEALSEPSRAVERRVAHEMGVPVIDMNQYLCGDSCGAIVGDVLLYRDADHITKTASKWLYPKFEEQLLDVLRR